MSSRKDKLIFEELSISDEVINVGEPLVEEIVGLLSSEEGTYRTLPPNFRFLEKKASIDKSSSPLFGNVIKVDVFIYFVKDKASIAEYYSLLNLGGEFNEDTMTISIRGFGIGDDINIEYLRSTLFHELKHSYQESLYSSNELPSMLSMATNIITHPKIYDKTTVRGSNAIYDISRLIYYFNKNEINANMESLYQELKTANIKDLKVFESQTLYEFELHKAMYDEYKIYSMDDNVCAELNRLYGKSFSQIMRDVRNGIDYFESRKRRVFSKYMGEKVKLECMSRKFRGLMMIR